MKKVKKKNLRSIDKVIVAFVAVSLIAITAIATKFAIGAVDANINASVSPSSVNTSQQVVVTVRAQTGTQSVNLARARVTFDASKWQYISEDYTGFGFANRTPGSRVGTGYHEVTGYQTTDDGPYPSGDIIIGRFTLKALSAATNTPIQIDQSNTEIYDSVNATNILGSVTGTSASITVTPTNPNPTPNPTPTPTPTPTPSSTSTKKSTGSTNTSTNSSSTNPATETDTPEALTQTPTTTNNTQTTNATLSKQSASSRQSFLAHYKTPILIAGFGLLLAAGASYAVAMYLHNRNMHRPFVTSFSGSGAAGAVMGSGMYGSSNGPNLPKDDSPSDDSTPTNLTPPS